MKVHSTAEETANGASAAIDIHMVYKLLDDLPQFVINGDLKRLQQLLSDWELRQGITAGGLLEGTSWLQASLPKEVAPQVSFAALL